MMAELSQLQHCTAAGRREIQDTLDLIRCRVYYSWRAQRVQRSAGIKEACVQSMMTPPRGEVGAQFTSCILFFLFGDNNSIVKYFSRPCLMRRTVNLPNKSEAAGVSSPVLYYG
ncbi:hypothetical protein RRG08_061852 [Elysia crispata]|uniref:Uncharacterized protein n=1 Tax=Elysia crispata TaxID=231223 RepID=A0AAE1APU1_9GAST|nr:hypothetical protein RRG08_061852 [Elysia crispata]